MTKIQITVKSIQDFKLDSALAEAKTRFKSGLSELKKIGSDFDFAHFLYTGVSWGVGTEF